jgi:N-acetylmuramoyl-L-alanine amidase
MHSPLAELLPSANFNQRLPRMIIIHHTNMSSFEAALAILQNSERAGQVSAHYLISRDGRIVQLVADDQRAWHAGVSSWGGQSDINSLSIGIELDNDGASPFPDAQMQALLKLLADLTTRLKISKQSVWAHADIAPPRKNDPSSYFDWSILAAQGFGLWPTPEQLKLAETVAATDFDAWAALAKIGYDLQDANAARRAFRRHYRGAEFLQKQLALLPSSTDTLGNALAFDQNAYTVWDDDWDLIDQQILAALTR